MSDSADAQVIGESAAAPAFFVVGIGASAGGIRALQRFFSAAPPKAGIAYVVILHLSPDHESNLAGVLQSSTAMPVQQVRESVDLSADHVFVVPPNKKLSLVDGRIEVSDVAGPGDRRAPIDFFFRTLAETQQSNAAAIVLSGTGADGSMGLKRIKELGGLCIVQEPTEADFSDMPKTAIATGLVDYVLPAADIPERLRAYRERHAGSMAARPVADDDKALLDVFLQLRSRTGHDFSGYKRSTLRRRIERRMSVHELSTLHDYASYLRENVDEARALMRDLLISVTNFFRDADAFGALEELVIAKLFDNKTPGDHVRAWVAGCATGEEAYSIAMLLAECTPDPANAPTIQIFATDLDEVALAKARVGYYTVTDVADVPTERLRRFFMKDGDGYRVRRELREMVLFASHNVNKDPPFAHLDLIACRNLLIYLNRAAQQRILKIFHFGLNDGGYLFLGNSESAEDVVNLFLPVSKEHHIFQSRGVDNPVTFATPAATLLPEARVEREDETDKRLRERRSYSEMHQRLLERYAAPSVVINLDYDILHLSDRAGRFLRLTGGEPSHNLLKLVTPELRLELHSALYHAVQNRTDAEALTGPVSLNGHSERVRIIVKPVFADADPSRGLILVLFDSERAAPSDVARVAQAADNEPLARQLEEELLRIKLQLRSTIEQHGLQQEELEASNEELQGINEELRSSSEELETSKEELQSLNEELTTVNQELKIKIEELSQASNDTRNLMNSTDMATVFVDRALRIKLFTPRARSVFNMIPADTGRPLFDITHRLRYPEMMADIEAVFDALTVREREVQSDDGRCYAARVLPYRTANDQIAGVVLIFADITERKRTEAALRRSEERLRLTMESVTDYAIITLDAEGVIDSWNVGAEQLFGYGEQEALGNKVEILFTPEDIARDVPATEMRVARKRGRAMDTRWLVRKDGSRFFADGVTAPMRHGDELTGYAKIARDLTERQRGHEERERAHEDLRRAHAPLAKRVVERTRELATATESLREQSQQREAAEQSRLRLLQQLVNVQEEERRRLSRDLHDQLGQQISAVNLKLSKLRQEKRMSAAARTHIEELREMTARMDADLDFLVWEIRPTALDDLGLVDALSDYVDNWSTHLGVAARLHVQDMEGVRLGPESETILYRVAQEALNNVVKHANARQVHVVLERDGDRATLSIIDDGNGFDVAENDGAQRGLGLVGVRERAALIGGSCTIRSAPGQGTTLAVQLPIAPQQSPQGEGQV